MSLLEICRQLNVSATYWYKLEREETSSINYDLLEKIDNLLSLDLNLDFPSIDKSNLEQDYGMNFTHLKWIKLVTPQGDEAWAYSRPHLKEVRQREQVIDDQGLTIFPLGFKRTGSKVVMAGDAMILTQRTKITHVVEVLDDDFFEQGGWFFRYVKVLWWQPEADWSDYPHRDDILNFPLNIQQSLPYELEQSLKAFQEKWGNQGGLKAFQQHIAQQLQLLGELQRVSIE
ncbi:hypothetical protein [[Leptolyngbya] sp. PCC 7376]|uniref:hypothetical protein n=1 Tax=[Leptolyngbya] sp. PCC 7376 TaxID=111781 RepID=UPI000309FECE|nr:hypothetical protein [[Leptolyngbya] sp. PCC 7376]